MIIKNSNVVRRYKAGYEIREEDWTLGEKEKSTPMKTAYTLSGDWIGNSKDAHYLCKTKGIAPEKRTKNSCVCSIGWSEKEQRYYGWSHRAIYGFKIGDKVKKGDCVASELPIGFKAKTIEDCEEMARAFAESVS